MWSKGRNSLVGWSGLAIRVIEHMSPSFRCSQYDRGTVTVTLGVPWEHHGSIWAHSPLLQPRAPQGQVHGLWDRRKKAMNRMNWGQIPPSPARVPTCFQCLSLSGDIQTWETPSISPFKVFIHWTCFIQGCFYRYWLYSNVKLYHKSSFFFDFYCYFHK